MHRFTWYFRHLDDLTNQAIASLGDGAEACSEMTCLDLNRTKRTYDLWRVTQAHAQIIWNNRDQKPLKFLVFRQIGQGPIRQVKEFVVPISKRPSEHKFIALKKGRPAVIFTGAALMAIGRRGRERSGRLRHQASVH